MTRINAEADSRYRAPALDKGLDILEILAARSEGMTRAELVRAMGRGPSEIYRMLERLVARGYVVRTEGGDRYALTMKLFLLGTRQPPLRRLIAAAQPLMDQFARETRQSCHLVVPERRRAVVIAHATPDASWEFRVRIGAELDLFDTSSGLTLLAFQPMQDDTFALGRWGLTDADRARLLEIEPHLDAIRVAGYREGPSAQLNGVIDLSAPILGPDGSAISVLTSAFIDHPGQRESRRAAALRSLRAVTAAMSCDAAA
jgi:DNA-binding IclR family transcriptional regulator